jgi:hypothetical protein
MTRQDNPPTDIVTAAVDAVRETPVPSGPPPGLESTLVAAGQGLEQSAVLHITYQRRRIVKRTVQASIAAVVLLIVVVLTSGLLFRELGNIAFADVAQRIRNAQSATWTTVFVTKDWNQNRSKTWLEKHVMKSYFKAPARRRIERLGQQGEIESVEIDDPLAGKHLELSPQRKRARTINRNPLAAAELGPLATDPLTRLKERLDGQATSLGKKQFEGRQVTGFRVLQNKSDPESSADLWVDAKSGQLVYVLLPGAHKFDPETDPARNNPPGEPFFKDLAAVVMRDIAFDVKLDDSLFSFEPPPQFSNEVRTKHEPTEKDVVEWFGVLAKTHGGVFPQQIKESIEKLNQLLKKERNDRTPEENKLVDQQFLADQGLVHPYPIVRFVYRLPRGDWHYAGSGIKLGDGSKAIFWYRPKGSNAFRVVYGDLSVKDVAAENLPSSH